MNALDATISMPEAMQEDARIKVMEFIQKPFTSRKPANPFVPVRQKQILSGLTESRRQTFVPQGYSTRFVFSTPMYIIPSLFSYFPMSISPSADTHNMTIGSQISHCSLYRTS